MTPHGVHFNAQLVRELRALGTAAKKWARAHPPSPTTHDILESVYLWESCLSSLQGKLAALPTETDMTLAHTVHS